MPVHDPSHADLARTVRSVDRQIWPFRELCIADDACQKPEVRGLLDELDRRPDVNLVRLDTSAGIAGATNAALDLATGDFAVFLDHDDELSDHAMTEIARCLREHPDADFVYSDHDVIDDHGKRLQVFYKPDWSPELLLSYMYVGHLKVVRTELARRMRGFRAGLEGSADHDFVLRVGEETSRIHHIPKVLYHWRAAPDSMARRSDTKTYAFESGRLAVEQALTRRKIASEAEWPDWARRARLGIYRLRFTSTRELPATILIPTRDRVDLLRDCVKSIEARTDHPKWQIVILDNDSSEPETIEYLEASPHRVLSTPGRFNFSLLVNAGVKAAETEHVVLLNNDTLVVSPRWLTELIGYSQMEGVGAVGAKLLYPDGRIQHAGVTLGVHGLTAHAFDGKPDRYSPLEFGYFAHVARNVSAVTAACMLVRRSLHLEIGGFDEEQLGVAWNDTDYCLRLLESGHRIVMNPYAELIHLGSASRGDSKNDREVRTMFERWSGWIRSDPYYNPNLSHVDTGFALRTSLNERDRLHYSPDGFEADPARNVDDGAPREEIEELDLVEICRNQENRIRELSARLLVFERADRAIGWLATRPLFSRLQRSPRILSLWQALRRMKQNRFLSAIARRLGLLN
jgi:GT2 family glycosyltransferase